MSCRHPDIRKFDGMRCCLACGEAVFESVATTAQSHAPSNSRYQYRRLNYTLGQEIHLLELLSADEDSDTIRCRMHHVNLEDDPAYEAVSYTWATEDGDARTCKCIQFADGKGSILVTRNCEAALRRLRKRGCSRYLWVDAICIDQTNISERNHQVGLMDRIFSSAWRVMMCLQDERCHGSVDYHRLFKLLSTGERLESSEVLTLDRLISARYFKRIWVIQEVALARSAYLQVNGQEIALSPHILQNLETLCSRHSFKLPSVLRWVPSQETTYDVARCLESAAECQATDSRDRIFALLSLMKPSIRALIPVDYSMTILSVHEYTRIAIISTSRSLDLIRYTPSKSNFDGSIGWLIGYTVETGFRLESRFRSTNAGLWQPVIHVTIRKPHERPYTPRSVQKHEVTFEKPDPRFPSRHLPIFWAKAHYIDTITNSTFCRKHGTRCRCSSYERQDRRDISMFPMTGIHACGCSCPTEDYWPQTTDHVILLERVTRRKDLMWYGWTEEYFRGVQSRKHWNSRRWNQFIPLSSRIQLQKFFGHMRSGGKSGCMFATRYSLGYAEYGFEVGDQIFGIDGVSVPFILRQMNGHQYSLVGECYLWAALDLHRWNPGTKKGRWWFPQPLFSEEASGQTRVVEINTLTKSKDNVLIVTQRDN